MSDTKLFENIFTNGYVSDSRLGLSRNKFQEMFDINKLAFILLNEKEIKSDINRKARDEVELLAYYNKAQRNGTVNVSYYQPANKLFGRYQARGKLSGQGILREVRHTIYADYYYDLDMVNAHPVILLWLCDYLNVECSCLREYVIHREQHIADIIGINEGVTRDDIKSIFLSINNGGLAGYNGLKRKTDFLVAYKIELRSLIDKIVSYFEPFHLIVKATKAKHNETFNINGATISHVLQYIENQLLMIIFQYLEERIGGKVYGSILCYDGIMIPKDSYDPNWQSELESIFTNEYGIDIKLKIKEMEPLDLTKYGFDEREAYELNYRGSLSNPGLYNFVFNNEDSVKDTRLINSHVFELDVLNYVDSLGEEFVYTDDRLHRFNGTYWEVINTEYVYGMLEAIYIKLSQVIDTYSAPLDEEDLEKLKKTMRRKVSVPKKQSYSKSLYDYIKSKYNKLESPFDSNIFLLGFTNGVFDLQANSFRRTRKTDYVSMVLPYDYSESSSADMEYVLKYLSKIMPREDERELLLQLLSTCLSGYVLDRFIVCTGLGANGKDTLFNYMLKSALGPLYYRASNTVITQKARGDLNVGIANMTKRRAIIFNEPSANDTINVALTKELTGSDEINARGLYSSNTSVHLHSTMFMLCNDKPRLDKVDAAIARRLITFQFRSTFKSQEFLDKNGLIDGENNVFVGDEAVKSRAFLDKYKLPFLNLLLPYFQRFKSAGYMITNIPDSIQAESLKYMEDSDPLYNWFDATYVKTGNKDDIIKLKDVFASLKDSEYYFNLTKAEKRNLSYKSMIEYVEKSPLLRMFYKERTKPRGKDITLRNILTNYRMIVEADNDN